MQHTLAHPEVCPSEAERSRLCRRFTRGTYELLDDLYSEVLPVLPFEMFNVCCDETWGLGLEGPTKTLGDEIGPGGVYVRAYSAGLRSGATASTAKRMMMWGDVILNHPDKLEGDSQGRGDAHLGLQPEGELRGPNYSVCRIGVTSSLSVRV